MRCQVFCQKWWRPPVVKGNFWASCWTRWKTSGKGIAFLVCGMMLSLCLSPRKVISPTALTGEASHCWIWWRRWQQGYCSGHSRKWLRISSQNLMWIACRGSRHDHDHIQTWSSLCTSLWKGHGSMSPKPFSPSLTLIKKAYGSVPTQAMWPALGKVSLPEQMSNWSDLSMREWAWPSSTGWTGDWYTRNVRRMWQSANLLLSRHARKLHSPWWHCNGV